MSPEQNKEIYEAVRQAIKDSTVDTDLHQKHHDYIDQLLAKEKRRARRWEQTKNTVIGAAALVVFGTLVNWLAMLGEFIKHLLTIKGAR